MKKQNIENLSNLLKQNLINEFNSLGIKNMPKVDDLNLLNGWFVNMEYILSNGQKIKLLDDEKVYFGNQIEKPKSKKCFGLVGDESYLLVCEYDANGSSPQIIIYKKRGYFFSIIFKICPN